MVKQRLTGVGLVVFAVVLFTGAYLGPFGTYQDVQSDGTTQATVLTAEMESATERDDGETEVEYYPRVEYEYAVDGTTYTDDRVFHPSQVSNDPGELRGKEFDAQSDARAVLDRYRPGTAVTVYYDPADPPVSYLEDPSTDLLISVGLMGSFGLLAAFAGLGSVVGVVTWEER